MAARKILAPVVTVETQVFWDAAKDNRFVVPVCTAHNATPKVRRTPFGSARTSWRVDAIQTSSFIHYSII